MAISFLTAGAFSGTNGSAPTPALPSGVQANDLLIAVFYSRGVTNETVAISSGWTQVVNDRTTGGLLGIWYRTFQTGVTAPTFTLTNHATGTSGDSAIAQVTAARGVDLTTPINTTGTIATNAASLNIGPITGFSLPAGDAVIVVGGKLDDYTSVATLTGDSLTWTEIAEADTTQGLDAGLVWNYAINDGTPRTITSKTFTVTGGTSVAGKGVMFSLNVAPLEGAIDLDGIGSISASPSIMQSGSASVSGGGTTSFSGQIIKLAAASLVAAGTLTAAFLAGQTLSGQSSLSGSSTQAASGSIVRFADTSLTGTSTGSSSGSITRLAGSTLTGTAVGSASGLVSKQGSVSVSGSGSGSFAAVISKAAQASLSASGTITGSAQRTQQASTALFGSASAATNGSFLKNGLVYLNNDSQASLTGALRSPGASSLSASGSLVSSGDTVTLASASLSSSSSFDFVPSLLKQGQSPLSGVSSIGLNGQLIYTGSSSLAGNATANTNGSVVRFGGASLSSSGSKVFSGHVLKFGLVTSSASGSIEAFPKKIGEYPVRITEDGKRRYAEDATFRIIEQGFFKPKLTLAGELITSSTGSMIPFTGEIYAKRTNWGSVGPSIYYSGQWRTPTVYVKNNGIWKRVK